MSQTSYAEQATAFAGMLGDLTLKQASTFVQAEAADEIPFGVMVAHNAAPSGGTPAKAVKLVDATSILVGVVVHSHDYGSEELGSVGLKPKTLMSVLERGRVWVNVEQAVTPADPVFVRHTAAGAEVKGQFRIDADTADAVRVWGAKFITSTSGAGLALLEVDMAAHRAH